MPVSEEDLALRTGELRPSTLLESHLARVLTTLERERASGVLDVDATGLRTTFYLRDGAIVFAEAGTVGETLGRLLVRRRTITPDQYAAILRRMTDALVDDELMRFGEVAIELGVLSHEQVSAGLAAQVRERLVRCLQLDRARWIFRDDPDASARVARFPCPLPAALFDALSEPQEAARWPSRLQHLGRSVIALAADPAEIASRLALGPRELRLVRSLATGSPSSEVLAVGAPDDDVRAATIATLLLLDLAQLRAHAEASPASPDPPRRARDDETPRRDPAEKQPHDPAEAAGRATAAALRLRQDIERRRVASTPLGARRDEARSRLTAEQHYAQGRHSLRDGKLAPALRDLSAASAAMPDAAEYRVARTLVEWLLEDDAELRAARASILRDLVLETLRADKRCAMAHYAQGRLHAAAADHDGAARSFAIASKLDASDLDAARWLRLSRGRVR